MGGGVYFNSGNQVPNGYYQGGSVQGNQGMQPFQGAQQRSFSPWSFYPGSSSPGQNIMGQTNTSNIVDPLFGHSAQQITTQMPDANQTSRIFGVFESLAQSLGNLIASFGSWIGVGPSASNTSVIPNLLNPDLPSLLPSPQTKPEDKKETSFLDTVWSGIKSLDWSSLVSKGFDFLLKKGGGWLGSIGSKLVGLF